MASSVCSENVCGKVCGREAMVHMPGIYMVTPEIRDTGEGGSGGVAEGKLASSFWDVLC